MLRAEVDATPVSLDNSAAGQDVLQEAPVGGLAGVLEQLRQKGGHLRTEDDQDGRHHVEFCIKEYFDSKLESVSCLKYWEKQDLEFGSHRVKGALCRLARYFNKSFCRDKL